MPPGTSGLSTSAMRALVSVLLASAACGNPIQPTPYDDVYMLRVSLVCPGLPESVATRQYIAGVGAASGSLAGATFWMSPSGKLRNTFGVTFDGDTVVLRFDPSPNGVVEETSPGAYLSFAGQSRGVVDRSKPGIAAMRGQFTAEVLYGTDLANEATRVRCVDGGASTFEFTRQSGALPRAQVAPALVRVLLQSPDSIAPQGSTTLGVLGQFADGSTRDVAADGQWESSNSGVLAIDGARVTGMTMGESLVRVSVPVPNATLVRAERWLFVVPEGTFRLEGWMYSGPGGSRAVGNGEVRVTAGSAAGMVVRSDEDGRFALFGVAGPLTLQFTPEGDRSWSCVIPAVVMHQSWTVVVAPPPRSGVMCLRSQ